MLRLLSCYSFLSFVAESCFGLMGIREILGSVWPEALVRVLKQLLPRTDGISALASLFVIKLCQSHQFFTKEKEFLCKYHCLLIYQQSCMLYLFCYVCLY